MSGCSLFLVKFGVCVWFICWWVLIFFFCGSMEELKLYVDCINLEGMMNEWIKNDCV